MVKCGKIIEAWLEIIYQLHPITKYFDSDSDEMRNPPPENQGEKLGLLAHLSKPQGGT